MPRIDNSGLTVLNLVPYGTGLQQIARTTMKKSNKAASILIAFALSAFIAGASADEMKKPGDAMEMDSSMQQPTMDSKMMGEKSMASDMAKTDMMESQKMDDEIMMEKESMNDKMMKEK